MKANRAHDRLAEIPDALAQREDFMARLAEAGADADRLAGMMAESIAMNRIARSLEAVGRDGRATICFSELMSWHCMDAAREAYQKAKGSNHE